MDTKLLRFAVEIESAGSISKAAENLYMSQPSLSKALRELEGEFGLKVFERNSRGTTPTARGRRFLKEARAVLERVDGMKELFSGEATEDRLAIAAPPAADIALALIELARKLGGVGALRLTLTEGDVRIIEDSVAGYESGIGILRCKDGQEREHMRELEARGLRSRLLRITELGVLMSAAHPLAEQKRLRKKEIKRYTEVTAGTASREGEGSFISARSGGMQLLLASELTDAFIRSPLPPERAIKRLALKYRTLEGKKELIRDYLIYRNGYRLHEQEEFFVAMLKNEEDQQKTD